MICNALYRHYLTMVKVLSVMRFYECFNFRNNQRFGSTQLLPDSIYSTGKRFTEQFSLNQVFNQFPNWQTYSCQRCIIKLKLKFGKNYVIDKTLGSNNFLAY